MDLLEKLKAFNCECTKTDDKARELLFNSWLTPTEISRITGISQPVVYNYIKDRQKLMNTSYRNLVKLEKCYDEIVKEIKEIRNVR